LVLHHSIVGGFGLGGPDDEISRAARDAQAFANTLLDNA
jgi:hypothetical protein